MSKDEKTFKILSSDRYYHFDSYDQIFLFLDEGLKLGFLEEKEPNIYEILGRSYNYFEIDGLAFWFREFSDSFLVDKIKITETDSSVELKVTPLSVNLIFDKGKLEKELLNGDTWLAYRTKPERSEG